MYAATVPLPTAVGPARTVSLAGGFSGVGASVVHSCTVSGFAELTLQRSHLVVSEASYPPSLGNPDTFHDLPGTNLAHAGHGAEQVDHPHLADHFIGVAPRVHDFTKGGAGVLEAILHLGTLASGLGGLLKRSLPSFWCQVR